MPMFFNSISNSPPSWSMQNAMPSAMESTTAHWPLIMISEPILISFTFMTKDYQRPPQCQRFFLFFAKKVIHNRPGMPTVGTQAASPLFFKKIISFSFRDRGEGLHTPSYPIIIYISIYLYLLFYIYRRGGIFQGKVKKGKYK